MNRLVSRKRNSHTIIKAKKMPPSKDGIGNTTYRKHKRGITFFLSHFGYVQVVNEHILPTTGHAVAKLYLPNNVVSGYSATQANHFTCTLSAHVSV